MMLSELFERCADSAAVRTHHHIGTCCERKAIIANEFEPYRAALPWHGDLARIVAIRERIACDPRYDDDAVIGDLKYLLGLLDSASEKGTGSEDNPLSQAQTNRVKKKKQARSK